MIFDSLKLQTIIFQDKKKAIDFEIKVLDPQKNPVAPSNCVEDLGILIDEDLNFSMHLYKLLNEAKRRVFFIFRSFKTRSTEILLPVYKSLVVSLFDFSSLVLPNGIAEHQSRIENIQKKFTQILLQHKQPQLNYG